MQFLASRCDGLILIGPISFQIMHALGQAVPSNLLERGAHEAALDIVKLAHDRNIPILCPKDFWCVNDLEKHLEIFPAQGILDGEIVITSTMAFYIFIFASSAWKKLISFSFLFKFFIGLMLSVTLIGLQINSLVFAKLIVKLNHFCNRLP